MHESNFHPSFLRRRRREEEMIRAMEEARIMAEREAQERLKMELRMKFCRSLQLESGGLAHTQEITRAFVFSYYELLEWLGLEVPDFDALKRGQIYSWVQCVGYDW